MKRVYCIHPGIHDLTQLSDYLLLDRLECYEDLVWDRENPELIIATEHIYFNSKSFQEFSAYLEKGNCLMIFHSGECIFPDLNIFDYAISFDCRTTDPERMIRIPTKYFFHRSIRSPEFINICNENELHKEYIKRKFCCFIYSNDKAHPLRDSIYHILDDYCRVDSLGKHLHNSEILQKDRNNNWRFESINIKSNYRFSIAAENARYSGYTSEKILTSFQSHSVPIYWGNPDISREFNDKAFIDAGNLKDIYELPRIIADINENEEKWMMMVQEPWQTDAQIQRQNEEFVKYLNFWASLFEKSVIDAKKTPEGTCPTRYRDFFMESHKKLWKY